MDQTTCDVVQRLGHVSASPVCYLTVFVVITTVDHEKIIDTRIDFSFECQRRGVKQELLGRLQSLTAELVARLNVGARVRARHT